jgi:hypothetical protein
MEKGLSVEVVQLLLLLVVVAEVAVVKQVILAHVRAGRNVRAANVLKIWMKSEIIWQPWKDYFG